MTTERDEIARAACALDPTLMLARPSKDMEAMNATVDEIMSGLSGYLADDLTADDEMEAADVVRRALAAMDTPKGFPDAEYVRSDLARPSQAGDERVEALVSFARPFADALDIECDFMTPPAPFEDGFDVRRRARAALAAMDTPKGGGDA